MKISPAPPRPPGFPSILVWDNSSLVLPTTAIFFRDMSRSFQQITAFPLLFVQFSSNIGVHVCQPYLLWPGDCSQAALHRTFDLSGKRSLTEIQSCPPSLTSEWLLTCQRLSLLISHLSLLGFKFVASVFVAPSCVLWWLEGSCGLHRTREYPDLIPNHWLS